MISKLEQHLGMGDNFELKGDKLTLKPIGVQFFIYIKRMSKMMKFLEGKKEEDLKESEMMENLDEECLNAIQNLVRDTLKESYPEEKEEVRNQFSNRYMFELLPKIIEINIPEKTHEAIKKKQAIERLQNAQHT